MRFTIWGEVGAHGPEGRVALGARLRLLLAGLLAGRNGEVGRNDLITIVWGEESEPADAEATLRLYISRLRKALGAAEPGAERLIATTPSGYRLVATADQVDAGVVEAALVAGRRPRELESLIAGEPFGSYADEWWCRDEVERLRAAAAEARQLPVESGATPPATAALPVPPNKLVGRAELVRLIGERLDLCRVVTLTAPGGCGKTRAAIAVADGRSARWVDGVFFVDLRPLAESSEVAGLVASEVGIPVGATTEIEDVVSFLAARQVLVVLDNCEHVIDSCAELLTSFLARPGPGRVLATSRERLDIEGECVVEVPPLDSDGADSPGVELFIERAVATNPRFDVEDVDAVSTLCRRLDGLPLAIELAAARALVLTLEELIDGLDDRFRVLSSGRRRARVRTLETTIDWSYQLLDDDEQRFFRSLAVFEASWDLAAAAAVSGFGRADTTDLMEALLMKSMAANAEPAGRFRLHETIRAFALKRLAMHDEEIDRRRAHFEYFSGAIERPPHFYFYSLDFSERCYHDLDDILAAIRYGTSVARWQEVAWLLKAAVGLASRRPSTSVGLLDDLDECVAHLEPTDDLHDQLLLAKVNGLSEAGEYRETFLLSRELTEAPDRFTSYMATVHMVNYLAYSRPGEALETLDAKVAEARGEPIDDREINSTTARVLLLVLLERYEEADHEIERYFSIEDQLSIRQGSGVNVAELACVLAWIRGRVDNIYDRALFDRYRLASGVAEAYTAVADRFIATLDAVANDRADGAAHLQGYATEALAGGDRREATLALVLLALASHVSGDNERARALLASAGLVTYAAGEVVARELARRLDLSREASAPADRALVLDTIKAEFGHRAWPTARRGDL